MWCHCLQHELPLPRWSQLLRVIDTNHHCALWRDDHCILRHNNGFADRESRSLTVVPGRITCTAHVDFIGAYHFHTQQKPQARGRAPDVHVIPLGIVLCWVDRIYPCPRTGFRGLNESSSHIWTTCAFFSVTLMGTSTLKREDACDEGIISASEHVSGHYCNTVWWHS